MSDEAKEEARELACQVVRENYRPHVRSVRVDGDTLVVTPIAYAAGKSPIPERVHGFAVRVEGPPEEKPAVSEGRSSSRRSP